MAYRVELTEEAREQFDDLPRHVQPQVYRRLRALGGNPRPPGVVYLKGQWKGLLRIRSDRKDVYE